MKFHIYFNWIPTMEECVDYINYPKDKIVHWEPLWYPHLEFVNVIEEHSKEWVKDPHRAAFRMKKLKRFGAMIPGFDSNHALFIRGKLDCDMTFAEEFELKNFPFDCQDLTCVIQERTSDYQIKFLPELRSPNFFYIDSTYSVINEWDLANAILTLGKSERGRTNKQYPQIEISLKLRRSLVIYQQIFYGLSKTLQKKLKPAP